MEKLTFRDGLKRQIQKYIRDAKKDGTVAMSVDCLKQCVRPPNDSYEGAPKGTNAQYYYAQMFREVCEHPTIKPFICQA